MTDEVAGVEFAGLENDGLENDGPENDGLENDQSRTRANVYTAYDENFNVYDM